VAGFLRADIFSDKSQIVCNKNILRSCRASPDLTKNSKIRNGRYNEVLYVEITILDDHDMYTQMGGFLGADIF